MDRQYRIEAYAIISADGMIADASGAMPDALKVESDQRFFRSALDASAAIALGRVTHEQERNSGRRRLVLTRRVAGIAPDPADPLALFWNPAGAPFEAARLALGLRQGSLAVIGGAEVYEVFFRIGYDAFHLTRANRAQIPGGKTVFPDLPPERTPEDVLKSHGLRPGPLRLLDAAAGITLVAWTPE
ncbi:MAG TPA: dihydrofolate reductase [Xanthobacteraceae bacterium]|jgi:dihydrofolate reductase